MYLIITLILVILDQLTKYYAITNLKGKEMVELVPNWLYLTYLENKGAAFGFLNTMPWVFTLLASVFVVAMIVIMLKYRNNFNSFLKLSLAIIIAGALGNLIDRFTHGYVVDFIFSPLNGLYNFPVFNLADVYLTLMAIVLAIYLIFSDGANDVN